MIVPGGHGLPFWSMQSAMSHRFRSDQRCSGLISPEVRGGATLTVRLKGSRIAMREPSPTLVVESLPASGRKNIAAPPHQ
jgi:hypothetical protein